MEKIIKITVTKTGYKKLIAVAKPVDKYEYDKIRKKAQQTEKNPRTANLKNQ